MSSQQSVAQLKAIMAAHKGHLTRELRRFNDEFKRERSLDETRAYYQDVRKRIKVLETLNAELQEKICEDSTLEVPEEEPDHSGEYNTLVYAMGRIELLSCSAPLEPK